MDKAYHYHRIEKGMECEDIKVAIFTRYMSDKLHEMTNNDELGIIETYEPYPPIYNDQTVYTENVFAHYPPRDTSTARSYQKHAERVVEIIRGGATKAKIYVFDLYSDYALNWCADNGIFAINTSWTNDGITDLITKYAYDKGLLMFTSAGNEGREDNPDLTTLAKSPWFYAIGSMHIEYFCELPDGTYDLDRYYLLYVPDYASEGEELDYCAIGEMVFDDGTYGKGSSFASPLLMLMLMQYAQRYLDYFCTMPDKLTVERFIDRNLTDVDDEGFDIYTGKGILRLPIYWYMDFMNDASDVWGVYVVNYLREKGIGKENRKRMLKFNPNYWVDEISRVNDLIKKV